MGAEAFVAAQIVDFAEATDDRVASLLVAGSGISLAYNDGAGTLTIASTVSPTWGSIGGTLASQTDLQSALNAKMGGSTGATDNRILRSDGTGGATVQNSAVTIDDSGNISGVANLTMSNTLTLGSFGVVAMNSSRGYFDCSALGVFYFRNFAGTKGFRLDCETTSGTVSFRNNDNSAASAINCGSITSSGNVFLTGTFPYYGIQPTGWTGDSFYFQSGVDNNAVGSGNFTTFVNGTTRSFSFVSGNPTTTGRRHLTIDAATSNAVFGGAITASGLVTCQSGFVLASRTKAAVLASSTAVNSGRFQLSDAGLIGREVYPDGTNWRYASDDSIVT